MQAAKFYGSKASCLLNGGKLVTSQVPGQLAPQIGIKEYCFEMVQRT